MSDTVTLLHRERVTYSDGGRRDVWQARLVPGCALRLKKSCITENGSAAYDDESRCKLPASCGAVAPGDVIIPGEADAQGLTGAEALKAFCGRGAFRVRTVEHHDSVPFLAYVLAEA